MEIFKLQKQIHQFNFPPSFNSNGKDVLLKQL